MTDFELMSAFAFHESGHAVALLRFHIPFNFAAIFCNENEAGWSGIVQSSPDLAKFFTEEVKRGDCNIVRFDHRMMVYFAGGVANEMFCSYMTPGERAHFTSVDLVDARNLLHWNPKIRPEDHEIYLDGIRDRTRRWMRRPAVMRQVEAVAAALMRVRRLEARQVEEICRLQSTAPATLAGLRVRVLGASVRP